MRDLTPKQAAFAKEYLVDLNGTEAAIRAGYSKKTARGIASQNLAKPHVQAAVKKAMEKRGQRCDISADRVLTELARLAFADTADVIRIERGRVVVTDTAKLTQDQRRAIAEISETQHGMRIKLHDKKGALELLGRHLGLFPTRMEHSGPNGGPIETKETTNLSDAELERIATGETD